MKGLYDRDFTVLAPEEEQEKERDVYKRQALENASSVAAMVLTTESLVADLPEPPAPAAPAGGDMGGMY